MVSSEERHYTPQTFFVSFIARTKLAVLYLGLFAYSNIVAQDRILQPGAVTQLSALADSYTHSSSTVTKSHNTQPVSRAPAPMLQCLPITHFLITAFSAMRVPSPIMVSGEI